MALGNFEFGLIIFIISYLIVLLVIFLFLFLKKGEKKIPYNANLVDNYIPQLTDGYVKLVEIEAVPITNGDWRVKVIPYDFFEREGEDVNVKEYNLIIKGGFRKVLAQGDTSSRRNIVVYSPPDFKLLPESIKSTFLGNLIDKNIDYEKLSEKWNKWQQNQNEMSMAIIQGMPEEVIAMFVRRDRELLEELKGTKQEDKKSSAPPFPGTIP